MNKKKESRQSASYDDGYFTMKKLIYAAGSGDVGFLREALAIQSSLSSEFFTFKLGGNNMITQAVLAGHEEFIRVAVDSLPPSVMLSLLRAKGDRMNAFGWNSLHCAVLRGLRMVKLIVESYKRCESEFESESKNDGVHEDGAHVARGDNDHEPSRRDGALGNDAGDDDDGSKPNDTTDDKYEEGDSDDDQLDDDDWDDEFDDDWGDEPENDSKEDECTPPWLAKNQWGETPLHLALKKQIPLPSTSVYLSPAKQMPMPPHPQNPYPNMPMPAPYPNMPVPAPYPNMPMPPPQTMPVWIPPEQPHNPKQKTTLAEKLSTKERVEVALYLFSLDRENLCNSLDKNRSSPLFYAVMNGFNRITEEILMSDIPYNLIGADGFSLLHFVSRSSEKVYRLLLEKHPDILRENDNTKGHSVLHKWAEVGKLGPLNLLVQQDISCVMDMICSGDRQGDTPLHVAIQGKKFEFAEALINIYKQEKTRESLTLMNCSLWTTKNKLGNTVLHYALYAGNQQLSLRIISEDASVCHIHNNDGETPLFRAVEKGQDEVVQQILKLPVRELIGMPVRGDGKTVLHHLSRCKEETGELLVEKFWWLNSPTYLQNKMPLSMRGNTARNWANELLSRAIRDPDSIKKAPFDWIAASRGGHLSALLAYLVHCPDFIRICLHSNDTPLHHIKLKNSNQYQELLALPIIKEMKNIRDYDEATPLHRALERRDKLLVEALLRIDGVDKSVPDKNGKNAMHLLAELAEEDQEWEEMCIRIIGIHPRLKTTYIHPTKTNLGEVRATLSVIAALLATLTFAAGFTVPGGFNNDTGEAILVRRPSLVVFLLADTFAMCCSMSALFCLMWSMVSDPNKTVTLIDQSVAILTLALYGTLVAFMTGVYTVIFRQSLWAAIVIFGMCSLIGVSANRTMLFKVLDKLIPATNTKHKDRTRLLEEGRAFEDEECTGSIRKTE